MSLAPHLFVLPLELSPFAAVLAALGAQEAFSAAQFAALLQNLAAAAAGRPLEPHALAQALTVAQALADVVGASGGGATSGAPGGAPDAAALVPDADGVMRPASDLAFDDAPWLEGAGADDAPRLVHPRIAAPVAEALGVASRRRLMLAASADCLSMSLTGGAVEAFGQSEVRRRAARLCGASPARLPACLSTPHTH